MKTNTSKRKFLMMGGAGLLLQLVPLGALASIAAKVVDVRLWPADEYTRVTLEHQGELRTKYFLMDNPLRMVVDLLDTQLSEPLKEITAKLKNDDPYVQQIRVGQFDPSTVRLVFDLKAAIRQEVFTIAPVATYGSRFVIDFYPKHNKDPLLALLDKKNDPGLDRDDELAHAMRLAREEEAGKPEKPSGQGNSNSSVSKTPENDSKNATKNNTGKETTAKAERPDDEAESTPAKTAKAPKLKRMVTIAIDPGHGGEDPGAIGPSGTYEKDVVLSISKMLKAEIDKLPGMRAMLTRDSDFFVPLGMRVQKARRVNADLFVSVHADAFIKPTARGSSVFVLSERGASSTAARWLANKENASDLIGGVNIKSTDSQLARVLLDLSTTAQISDSLKLGDAVLGKIGRVNRLHKPKVEQAAFAVLRAPDIPSILVETAFISNPDEEEKLRDAAHQRRLAQAMAQGIMQYFAANPPLARRLT